MIYVAAAFLALAANHLWPSWPFIDQAPIRAFGAMLLAVGLALDVWAMATMSRRRDTILPHRAATALVTTGPFALPETPSIWETLSS